MSARTFLGEGRKHRRRSKLLWGGHEAARAL